ncbi:MAG: recF [Acidimicrobiaceae bacterium]|nr:recF [Acidimicrobiaceae bacterium]
MLDFRNLVVAELVPSRTGMTVVTGENGAGKTSLLEAIGYGSTLRSFRASPREALVRAGAERAIVRLEVADGARQQLVEAEIVPGRRDRVQLNRQRVGRAEELLEALRVTVFTPDDLALVKGPPEGRRDYLDDVLESAHPRLGALRRTVERVLRQRNTLLRQGVGRITPEVIATLEVWDAQLATAGEQLATARAQLAEDLSPYARGAFARLTRLDDPLELSYRRSFDGSLAEALAQSREEDLRRGITTVGPQRDDLGISAGGLDARTRLSQGRQRSVTLALRLAAHEVVTENAGSRPVLLLDDAFSELDEAAAAALLDELPTGQAILTTAGPLPPGAKPASTLRLEEGRLE